MAFPAQIFRDQHDIDQTVDKRSLKEKIGTLSKDRLAEIYEGMTLIMDFPGSDINQPGSIF